LTLIKSISGIRGTVGGKPGDGLTPLETVKFTAAFGHFILSRNKGKKIVIGRDARTSGEMLNQLIVGTLSGLGFHVIDLGLSTTPTVELAVTDEKAAGGIIITASHNPKQWNALKLLNERGEFISEAEGKKVLKIADDLPFTFAENGNIGTFELKTDAIQKHIEKIVKLDLVDVKAIKSQNFKIVVDAVNSTGGIAVPKLLNALGVKNIIELNCEPNGKFAHNPEPLPDNLSELAQQVKLNKADLGIAVDPDVDRLALVCDDGSMFGEEYTLVAVADYILQNKKGATVSNISSSRALQDVTEKHKCQYFPAAVGEVNVVDKMKEVKAVIGGEGNGGVIYPELHYGRDALVGIALFLTHLAKSGKTISVLRSMYPNYYMSKNKIAVSSSEEADNIISVIKKKYGKQPTNSMDGLRIDFDKDWIILRKSNTEPIIRIYAESQHETTADNLAKKIITDIKALRKGEE
jgi:phosphomannomutase